MSIERNHVGRSLRTVAMALTGASLLAACAGVTDSPTAPLVPEPTLAAWPHPVVPQPAANVSFSVEQMVVCKVFANAPQHPSAQFTAVITDVLTGVSYDPVSFVLADGQCADLGFVGGYGVDVLVTEAPIPGYTTTYTTQLVTKQVGLPKVLGPVLGPFAGSSAVGEAFGSRNDGRPATGTRITFINTYNSSGGCTYTQGYWKTHSAAGPAPYDNGWKALPGGREHNTVFFTSGKTWLQIWTTPPRGSAYINLAHQYMAAKLNVLNGASAPPNVLGAITTAEAYFTAGGVGQVAGLASLLDDYNNGLVGPGHCG